MQNIDGDCYIIGFCETRLEMSPPYELYFMNFIYVSHWAQDCSLCVGVFEYFYDLMQRLIAPKSLSFAILIK